MSKTYKVVIRATLVKTVTVEALDEAAAIDAAHQEFSVLNTGEDEDYEQETLGVREVRS